MTRHVYPMQMRWSDMDALGHVNNAKFIRYIEQARVDLLFDSLDDHGVQREPGVGVLVVSQTIDYRRPLKYRKAPAPIELWVSRIGTSSFVVSAEVVDTLADGSRVTYAEASTTLVQIDLASERPAPLAADYRAFLERLAGE